MYACVILCSLFKKATCWTCVHILFCCSLLVRQENSGKHTDRSRIQCVLGAIGANFSQLGTLSYMYRLYRLMRVAGSTIFGILSLVGLAYGPAKPLVQIDMLCGLTLTVTCGKGGSRRCSPSWSDPARECALQPGHSFAFY